MNLKTFIMIVACSCFFWSKTYGVSFQASYLEIAAKHLKFDKLDTLKTGANIVQYQGLPVIIIKNDAHVITHIGYKLFAPLLREEHPSPVYNFIEYALLDNKVHFSDNPFTYKDLKFLSGSWKDVEAVNEATGFQIEAIQNKYYLLTWLLGNDQKVSLQFPINYERLSLVNRKELEQNIIRDLKAFHLEGPKKIEVRKTNLLHDEKGVAYKAGNTYLDKEINNNMYFQNTNSSTVSLMYSPEYPLETMANLCVAADFMDVSDSISIDFVKYDYTKERLSVRMADFIGFMRNEGCVPFWGAESIDEDKIEGALFLYDKDKGFNHVLKIETGTKDIASGKRLLKATAYLLSPTTNVRDLNYQYSGTKK